jgi:hypothetical protein
LSGAAVSSTLVRPAVGVESPVGKGADMGTAPTVPAPIQLGQTGRMDAPTAADLILYRLNAAAQENARLGVLLRACGATIESVAQELLDNGWRDVEAAVAIAALVDQVKRQLTEELTQ